MFPNSAEAPTALWCSAHFFFLLAAYYVIHAICEAMGLTGGIAGIGNNASAEVNRKAIPIQHDFDAGGVH